MCEHPNLQTLVDSVLSYLITSSSHHAQLANIEFDEVLDLAGLDVIHDGVVDLHPIVIINYTSTCITK